LRPWLRWLLALTLLLDARTAWAQAGPAASVDVAEEADLQFRIAVQAYRKGDFQTALEHLLVSNRLVPNKNVVFNIARAYEQLGQYDEAFRHYHEYVQVETDPKMRAAGEEAIERIRRRLALVHITSDPPGATIYIDRRDLGRRGTTPSTLALPPGQHAVLLDLDGYHGTSAETSVALGKTAEVSAHLDRVLGAVKLTGTPADATVRLGSDTGPIVGTLPGTVHMPPGPQVLVVQAPSYQPVQRLVQVTTDAPAALQVDLALRTGTVVVNAVERDALIEIDGKAAGFTPAVLDVPVGKHVVRVTRTGFRPFEQKFEVQQDQRTTVDVRLRSQQEVTAATRTTRSVDQAPTSVSVVSRAEIRAFGYQSVYDALAATRGIFQTNDLSYEYLGFRGFGRPGDYGNRVLVTIDGHAINDDQLGASYIGTDLSTDLHDVEQIEVVRGPGSALYGTNAYLGVVNVVTAGGGDIPKPRVTVTADGLRTVRTGLGAGFGDAKRGAWVSAGALGRQGGDYYFSQWDTPADGDGYSRGADGAVAGNFQAKAWYDDWTLQLFFNGRRKHVPTGAYETPLGDPRTTNTDLRSFAELRFEPRLGPHLRLYARAWDDFYAYGGNFPYPPDYVASDRWRGSWAGFEPRLVATPLDWLEVTVGAEARLYYDAHLYSYDDSGGAQDRYLDEKPTQEVYAGYVLAEGHWADRLRVSLGGRYDYFTLHHTGGAFSPRAALIWSPSDHDVLKVVGGTAFRAPSPYEWFYNDDGFTQVAPVNLNPERIWTGEVEYTHRFDDVTRLTVASYYDYLPNLIDTELTGQQGEEGELFRYSNSTNPISTVGLEYEIRRDWRRGVMVSFSHSMQRTRQDNWFTGAPITNSPEHLLALKLAVPLVPGVSTVATRLRAASPRLTTQDTYTRWAMLWDITVTGELPIAPVRFGLGIRNLLDWQYGNPGGVELRMPEVPQPGRTLFVTLEGHL